MQDMRIDFLSIGGGFVKQKLEKGGFTNFREALPLFIDRACLSRSIHSPLAMISLSSEVQNNPPAVDA